MSPEQNGGAPSLDCHVQLANGRVEEIFSLFGVGMSEASSELAWNARTFAGRLPPRILAFANDPAGNLYTVDESGAVCFWDHEMEGRAEAIVPIGSFEEFLAALSLDAS